MKTTKNQPNQLTHTHTCSNHHPEFQAVKSSTLVQRLVWFAVAGWAKARELHSVDKIEEEASVWWPSHESLLTLTHTKSKEKKIRSERVRWDTRTRPITSDKCSNCFLIQNIEVTKRRSRFKSTSCNRVFICQLHFSCRLDSVSFASVFLKIKRARVKKFKDRQKSGEK